MDLLGNSDGLYDCRGMVERAVRGSERTAFVQRDTDSNMLMRRCRSGEQCKRKGGQCSWKEHGCPSGLKERGCECGERREGLDIRTLSKHLKCNQRPRNLMCAGVLPCVRRPRWQTATRQCQGRRCGTSFSNDGLTSACNYGRGRSRNHHGSYDPPDELC